MPKVLTTEQVSQYQRDGCLFPFRALREDEALHYRRRLEDHESRLGGKLTEVDGASRFKNHLLLRWVHELVCHPAILDAIEDVIGPDILCYTSTFFIKEPNSPDIAAWHQDATYFGLRPYQHVTAWLALTDASPEGGCMEFLPGSPAFGQLHHQSQAIPHSVNGGRQLIVDAFDDRNSTYGHVKAGEFSLHNTLCVHRSAPNRSDDRRIGIGISYVPTRVRHIGTKRMPAMLVRGEDRYGHFDLEPAPAADLDEAAQAAHASAYARYRENYNEQLAWHDSRQPTSSA